MLLSRMLIQSRLLEQLDLSYNQINRVSCFCIAQGLRLSRSIHKLSLEANPIGSTGMKQLMKAKNENQNVDFELNLKLCDSEVDLAAEVSQQKIFDLNTPEGAYTLKLEKQYDQIVLQHLLDLSAELAEASSEHPNGAFEQKLCF